MPTMTKSQQTALDNARDDKAAASAAQIRTDSAKARRVAHPTPAEVNASLSPQERNNRADGRPQVVARS